MGDLSYRIKLMQVDLNRRIPNLNSGGCVQFAYFFSKKLKSLNVPHRVYYLDYYQDELIGDTCEHVVVYIRNIGYIDGYKTKRHVDQFKLTRDDINKTRKSPYWNTLYNKNYNRLISQTINEYFDGYKHTIRKK